MITDINASDNMSEETLQAINFMVDKVSKMSTKEIEILISPQEVKDAIEYISLCHRDIGFMGSPKYDIAKKIVDDYDKSCQNKSI